MQTITLELLRILPRILRSWGQSRRSYNVEHCRDHFVNSGESPMITGKLLVPRFEKDIKWTVRMEKSQNYRKGGLGMRMWRKVFRKEFQRMIPEKWWQGCLPKNKVKENYGVGHGPLLLKKTNAWRQRYQVEQNFSGEGSCATRKKNSRILQHRRRALQD